MKKAAAVAPLSSRKAKDEVQLERYRLRLSGALDLYSL